MSQSGPKSGASGWSILYQLAFVSQPAQKLDEYRYWSSVVGGNWQGDTISFVKPEAIKIVRDKGGSRNW
ncbi:hypothetical protein [Izhakiella capsodis]|uniref:hypothetical protein n=1 Tax=Izhakiella capsodis TaxID=1367852 RepID=UPI001160175A|nr:hypothetical protein [Izhakiella capsodis]